MNATEEILHDRARQAQARFFLKSGRERGLKCGDGVSMPLFGLAMILEAEGLIARDLQYLKRCEQAIVAAVREWRG